MRLNSLIRAAGALSLWAMLAGCATAGAYDDFFRAVKVDYPSQIVRLAEKGFDVNALSEDGQPALVLAIKEDSDKVVDALLALPQLNLEARNAAGESALMMAAIRGKLPTMQKLLARGVTVNHAGWTPLHYAASQGGLEGIELLLAKDAQINARSPNGTTPLMMAARYGSEDAANLLLRRGADATLKNDKGLSAADFARTAQRAELAKRIESPR